MCNINNLQASSKLHINAINLYFNDAISSGGISGCNEDIDVGGA
jgi:hypothetical protein